MTPAPTPIEAFLAPLARLAQKHPEIEGLVFWDDAGFSPTAAEALESEEIAFYAEGLLLEGFRMVWQVVAEAPVASDQASEPARLGRIRPDHIRLYFWQEGVPPVPAPLVPWVLVEQGRWDGGA